MEVLDLDKLQEICEKATPGSWDLTCDEIISIDKHCSVLFPMYDKIDDYLSLGGRIEDINFIISARKYMPLIIERCRELEDNNWIKLGDKINKLRGDDE